MTKRTIELDLPDDVWKRIERLAGGMQWVDGMQPVEGLLTHLIDHIQQGVYRSGAWEREWLSQCVDEAAIQKAWEQDERGL